MKNDEEPLNEDKPLKLDNKMRLTNRASMKDMFKTRDSTNFPAISRNKRNNSTNQMTINTQLMKSSSGFTRTVKTI